MDKYTNIKFRGSKVIYKVKQPEYVAELIKQGGKVVK